MPFFNRITILGPGLLGASLAMAIKKKKLSEKTRVWARKPKALQKCLEQEWCDETFDNLEDAVIDSDLVIICTPVDHIERVLNEIMPKCSENTIITDVGSVKESICKAASEAMIESGGTFIGSHPMAGSEKSGMDYASAELFENRTCLITPDPEKSTDDIEKLENFWKCLGMRVLRQTPEEHDWIVSNISHLPHLIASSLSSHLSSNPKKWSEMAGQGLKDTTRVAQGDPALWCEIMKSNHRNLSKSLELWIESVNRIRDILREGNWEDLTEYLADAAEYRKGIR